MRGCSKAHAFIPLAIAAGRQGWPTFVICISSCVHVVLCCFISCVFDVPFRLLILVGFLFFVYLSSVLFRCTSYSSCACCYSFVFLNSLLLVFSCSFPVCAFPVCLLVCLFFEPTQTDQSNAYLFVLFVCLFLFAEPAMSASFW